MMNRKLKLEVCPVCLMNERDALRLELKQVSARLLHADKEIDRLANENKIQRGDL
jgi:hypothetical protein